jgi:hypothetical protein
MVYRLYAFNRSFIEAGLVRNGQSGSSSGPATSNWQSLAGCDTRSRRLRLERLKSLGVVESCYIGRVTAQHFHPTGHRVKTVNRLLGVYSQLT